MKDTTKEYVLAGAGLGATLLAFIGVSTFAIKSAEKRKKEEERFYKEHNEEVDRELSGIHSLNSVELIEKILRNSFISSTIKNLAIGHIKCGRNKIDGESAKQIYRICNDGFVKDSDKSSIIHNICDGHIKTIDELRCETQENIARYEYLQKKEAEETKRQQQRYNLYKRDKENENSLKKTKIFADAAKEVLTNINLKDKDDKKKK